MSVTADFRQKYFSKILRKSWLFSCLESLFMLVKSSVKALQNNLKILQNLHETLMKLNRLKNFLQTLQYFLHFKHFFASNHKLLRTPKKQTTQKKNQKKRIKQKFHPNHFTSNFSHLPHRFPASRNAYESPHLVRFVWWLRNVQLFAFLLMSHDQRTALDARTKRNGNGKQGEEEENCYRQGMRFIWICNFWFDRRCFHIISRLRNSFARLIQLRFYGAQFRIESH